MKKFFTSVSVLLFSLYCLSGCSAVGDKTGGLDVIYGVCAVVSLLLLFGCIALVHKKKIWFITLFVSVLVVNTGYTLLSVSTGLSMALWANRISYLGSVFLPLTMLMIILNVTNTAYRKRLPATLLAVAIAVFLIAASPGILPIYYKEVSFEIVDGVSALNKEYGPLHPIYLLYLLGYFSAMVVIIIRANIKKAIDTTTHAVFIALAVFVNIGVWFVEQLVRVDFELLSVSYIISELFLLGVHMVMNENQRLREVVRQVEVVKNYSNDEAAVPDMLTTPIAEDSIAPERVEFYMLGLQKLTPTEKAVYDAYIARVTTKEIMAKMNIKESTLKYHNRNLYSKLGVSTRKELLELHKYIVCVKSKLDV